MLSEPLQGKAMETKVGKCISCFLSTLGKEWFILIWFFLLISQFLTVFQAFLMAKSTVIGILEIFWAQPWHTLRMKGSSLSNDSQRKENEGPVSCLGTLLLRGGTSQGFVGSSFPDQGLNLGPWLWKHRQGIPYWVTADITADASALLRTQVMGKMNHQDNQAQKGNLKKRKRKKKKRKAKPSKSCLLLYNRKDEKEQNIKSVLYNLLRICHKHKDKIVTYSDKDCSLKKKDANTKWPD